MLKPLRRNIVSRALDRLLGGPRTRYPTPEAYLHSMGQDPAILAGIIDTLPTIKRYSRSASRSDDGFVINLTEVWMIGYRSDDGALHTAFAKGWARARHRNYTMYFAPGILPECIALGIPDPVKMARLVCDLCLAHAERLLETASGNTFEARFWTEEADAGRLRRSFEIVQDGAMGFDVPPSAYAHVKGSRLCTDRDGSQGIKILPATQDNIARSCDSI